MHAPAPALDGVFPLPSTREGAPPREHAAPSNPLSSNDSSSHRSIADGSIADGSIADGSIADGSSSNDSSAADAKLPPSFTAELLAETPVFSPLRELRRFGIGLGLSALYGLALGARQGGKAFFAHAAGVPAALLAVTALGVPALYIALALFDAPIEPPRAVTAASRATAQAGLVLAGLAPAAALFVVSSDLGGSAAFAGAIGLTLGGAIGLRVLLGELRRALREAKVSLQLTAALGFLGFGVFAVALAARIWTSALPLLGGAR